MTIDTVRTPNAVCPHCGHVDRDSWEINCGPGLDGDTTTSCGSCGEEFHVTRIADISYTTAKLATGETQA